jgi:hypothetical protein
MAKVRNSTRTNRRQLTKGSHGIKAARAKYYAKFRNGHNRVNEGR